MLAPGMWQRPHPGYGIAAITTVALVLTAPGQTMLVSLLNLPLRETFAIEPLVLNGAYTAATLAASIPLVWIGSLTDRLGPRRMLMILGAAFGGACLFTAAVAHVAMVFVAFFALRFLGPGALAVVSHHALAMWFHRRLGTIAGFQLVALYAVWAAVPAATALSIEAYGWRLTWGGAGVAIALTLVTLSWRFMRDRPEDLGLGLDAARAPEPVTDAPPEPGLTLGEAKATRAFWVLAAASALPPMIGTALLFDIQPLYLARGLDPSASAFAVGAWSATMAVMALPSGRIIDVAAPRWPLALGTLTIALSCALWLVAASAWLAVAAVVAYGVGQSLVAATTGTTAARFFGRRHHGAIRSYLARLGIVATGLGPLTFGVSHRLSGGYDGALVLFGLLCLPAALAATTLAPPP